MKNTALISSRLLDLAIIALFKEFGIQVDPSADFVYEGSERNNFQTQLGELPADTYQHLPQETTIFKWDSIVGDSTYQLAFEAFKKKNNFSLDIPVPPARQGRVIYLTAAAIMQLIMQWPERQKAKKEKYIVPKELSFTQKELFIDGFMLRKMDMITRGDKTVGAELSLNDGFSMDFFDFSAFENAQEILRDHNGTFDSLYALKPYADISSWGESYMMCPCIQTEMHILDHLKGIKLINKNAEATDTSVQVIEITDSESLGKLELSEWGVKARVETRASAHMLLGASADRHHRGPGPLIINQGLIFVISHQGKEILRAYVPQEEFKKI